jgi:hypothetical protein
VKKAERSIVVVGLHGNIVEVETALSVCGRVFVGSNRICLSVCDCEREREREMECVRERGGH